MRNARKSGFSWLRRVLSLVIVLTLLLGEMGPLASLDWGWGKVSAEPVTAFAGGEGTEQKPYEIPSAEHLRYFASLEQSETKGKFYKLTADITLTGTWEPIAGFAGTFDGDGHSISGLTIRNTDSASNVGLFGTVAAGTTIKNVTLKGVAISVTCNANAAISVAALVGKVDIVTAPGNVTIDNCAVVGGSIQATAPTAAGWKVFGVGGIVGSAVGKNASVGSTVSITNCYNSADVTADNSAVASNGAQIDLGGIAGAAYCDDAPTGAVSYKIVNCGNTGNLTAKGGVSKEVGGMAGRGRTRASAGTYVINNCYNADAMIGPGTRQPIVYTKGGNGQTISNTYYYQADTIGNNTGSTLLTLAQVTDGTLLGYLNTNKANINGALSWVADAQNHPVLKYEAPVAGLTGLGTEAEPYKIANEKDLRYFAGLEQSETKGKFYKLTADITLTGTWEPIDSFAGTFDGDGHSISGLTISNTNSASNVGLFGTVAAGATIKNVTLKDVSISVTCNANAAISVAALVGKVDIVTAPGNVTIDNCAVVGGSIQATAPTAAGWRVFGIGGIVGSAVGNNASVGSTVSITNCYNSADVTADNSAVASNGALIDLGGIVGAAYCDDAPTGAVSYKIVNCGNTGDLTAVGGVSKEVGGMVGRGRTKATAGTYVINNCYNTGAMIGPGTRQPIVYTKGGNGQTISNTYYYQADTIGNNTGSTLLTLAQVTDGTLLDYLNTNKATITGALSWAADAEGYPAPTTAEVELPGDVKVSWTAPANGTLTVTKEDNTAVNSGDTFTSGTKLIITVTPATGCVLKALTVNNAPVTVTEGVYELILPNEETVTIAAQFEVPNYKWTDPQVVATGFAGGNGEKDTPYQIATGAQLGYLSTLSKTAGKYYQLTADIDLSANQWVPVKAFAGTFDGNGKTITGMKLSGSYDTAQDMGLFGTVNAGATIQNVILKDTKITVTQTADKAMSVGALVGKIEYAPSVTADTLIDNCYVIGSSTVSVTANAIGTTAWTGLRVGGLIGNLDANKDASGTITVINCFNAADVTVTATGGGGSVAVGGIGGYMGAAGASVVYHVLNSGSIGALTASTTVQQGFVGGIVGWTKSTSANTSIDNCYSAGTMTGGLKIGNIAAQQSNTTNNWQRLYGLVTGGSIAGTVITTEKVTNGTLLGDLNTNKETINNARGWEANADGYPMPTKAAEPPVNVQVSWTAPTNGTLTVTREDTTAITNPMTLPSGTKLIVTATPKTGYVLKELKINGEIITPSGNTYTLTLPRENSVSITAEFEVPSFLWTDPEIVATGFAGGTGAAGDPYQIATGAQLGYLATQTKTEGKYYKLTANIDLSAHKWVPIKSFAGTFDGNGKTITGMKISGNYNTAENLGLFGAINAGVTIRNVTLKDAKITVTQTDDKAMNVGALVGKIEYAPSATADTLIDSCTVTGNSTVSVTANAIGADAWTGVRVGGLIGSLDANKDASGTTTVINCFNGAAVTVTATSGGGSVAVGGIAGAMIVNGNDATFQVLNSANIGVLSASSTVKQGFVGGVAGWTKAPNESVTKPTLDNCYSTGTVSGGTKVGGVVSQSSNVTYDGQRLYGQTTNGSIPGTQITASQMIDGTLLSKLNTNREDINNAREWAANAQKYPVPTGTVLTPVSVKVSWKISGSGTLAVTKADGTAVSNSATLPSGTKLIITFTPAKGNVLRELLVNEDPIILNSNTYTLVLPRKSTVSINAEFGVPVYLWTDPGIVATGFAGGNGQSNNPYQIANGAQLGYLATQTDTKGKYYKLTANIDLSANEWVPIKDFAGHFNGNGKTISGMKIDKTCTDFEAIGLFGTVLGGTTIQNLTLKNVDVTVKQTKSIATYVGGLVGQVIINQDHSGKVTINKCSVGGKIVVTTKVTDTYCDTAAGGILGYTKPAAAGTVLISNSVNSTNVSLTDRGTAGRGQLYVGGIAAHMDTATQAAMNQILNCGNTGSMTVAGKVNQARIGGVVGRLRQSKEDGVKAQLSNCYNAGNVNYGGVAVSGDWATLSVGSVIGQGQNLNLGTMNWLKGTAPSVGIKQTTPGLSASVMKSSSFVATLNKNAQAMADIGISGIIPWVRVSGGYPVIGNGAALPVKDSWITDENAASSFGGGDGSRSNPYLVKNAAQLGYLAKQSVNGDIFKGKYIRLTANIDLSAHPWIPIKKFEGTFDGNGRSISGLRVGSAGAPVERLSDLEWGAGMFNNVTGTVKNLTVQGSVHVSDTMSGQHYGVAIIVGHLEGTVSNCTARGTVTAQRKHAFAGGIAGVAAAGSTITNCANEARVSGGSSENITRIGGIAGYAVVGRNSKDGILIANCYNVGTITAISGNAAKVAGLVANTENNNSAYAISLYNCYNAGEVLQGGSATGALLANSCATKSGKNTVNVNYLYAANPAAVEAMTETLVTSNLATAAFAEELTINADLLVGDGLCSSLRTWVGEDGKTPVFGSGYVTGTLARLDVTANHNRMGIITILGDERGGDNFVPITKKAVEKGSKIKLTIEPKSCIKLVSVKFNGEEKISELKEGTMIFTVKEAVKVEVTFEVERYVDLDPIYVNLKAAAGGDGSEAKPFTTLAEAQEKLRTLLAEHPTGNITVHLMDGTYRLQDTWTLTEEDSTFGRVVITGYEGGNPIITGAQTTGKFEKVKGKNYYSYQLPDSAKVEGEFPLSHDLFVNGERAILARTEDKVFQYGFENVVMTENGKYVDYADNAWYIDKALLENVPDNELRFVEMNYLQEWKHTMLHLESRDSAKTQGTDVKVTMNTDEVSELFAHCATLKSPVGETYWLQNHLAFLDDPGEYYYDQARGIIYYMPYSDQDMDTARIEYGTLDILVSLDHAENITFDGIDFDGATTNWATENGLPGQLSGTQYGKVPGWGDCGEPIPCAAIYGDYATGIKVVNCIFEELGGSAVILRFGTKDLEVTGNIMRNLGMNGVQVGVAQLKWNQDNIPGQAENVTISNNYITNIGTVNLACPAIAVKRAENLTISHNKIVHTPYSGITAGWGFDHTATDEASNKNLVNAEIAFNYIEDFIHKNNDGGGIYVCGANADIFSPDPFNYIHDNYIRAGAHNKTYTGIYHDGSSSNWLTYHNFVDDLSSDKGPMFFQDDVQTQYTHNITAQDNFSTCMPITQSGSLDLMENYRNIYLDNNTFFENRGEASEEALQIMYNAGLEEEYAHLEKPMDAEVRIADDSMHYLISLKTFDAVKMRIALTNNTDETRTYTISADGMPENYALTINRDRGVKVKPGETVIVKAKFTIIDTAAAKDEGEQIVGLVVKDDTGRETEYRRVFTIRGVNRVLESDSDMDVLVYIGIGVIALVVVALGVVLTVRRRKTARKTAADNSAQEDAPADEAATKD